jgi:hypothetical protein
VNIADILATIIAVAAILYSVVSTIMVILNPDKYKPAPPQDDEMQGDEMQEEVVPFEPPVEVVAAPPPQPEQPPEVRFRPDRFRFETKMDRFRQKTAIEERSLESGLRRDPNELVSDAVRLSETPVGVIRHTKPPGLNDFGSKKLMWISHEIFSKPVSERSSPFPWDR